MRKTRNRLSIAVPSMLALAVGAGLALGSNSGLTPLGGLEAQTILGGESCLGVFITFEQPPGTGCNGCGTTITDSCCPHQPRAVGGAGGSGAETFTTDCFALNNANCGTSTGRRAACGGGS